MKSLTLVGVVFICILGIVELDGTFLDNSLTNPVSDCGKSLALTSAMQWYKGCFCGIKTHEIGDPGGVVFIRILAILELDGRFLHTHLTDSGSDCGRLLGLTLATQRYELRLGRIKTLEFSIFYRWDIRSDIGDTLLDGRFLHNCITRIQSDCRRQSALMLATQWYKVRLC